MSDTEWVAVAAIVDVNGLTFTAVHNVKADLYDSDETEPARAGILARCSLEDTLRESHPHWSINDASGYAYGRSRITVNRYTAEDTVDLPF